MSKSTPKNRNIPFAVRQAVLLEAGYKCANPVCRNVLALELHHIVWVKEGGNSTADNLLALCGHCHDLHTAGHIPVNAIGAWKGLLVSLNNPNRASVDFLLVLYDDEIRLEASEKNRSTPPPFRFTGDGLGLLAPMITSGLVHLVREHIGMGLYNSGIPSYEVRLTERGRLLVKAWRDGNAKEIKRVLELPRRALQE